MFQELLAREFAPYGRLSPEQLTHLADHYSLLCRWNQRMNLTRIGSLEEAIRLHYCESLFLATCLPEGPLDVADVGSGAGFPGIPMAVLRPELTMTLIESHHRKSVFLAEACRTLANVKVLAQRAEGVANRFDWIVSRAVAPDEILHLKLAPRATILMSDTEVRDTAQVKRIPWGKNRVAALFHVELNPS